MKYDNGFNRQDVIDYVVVNKDALALKASVIMTEYENRRKLFENFLIELKQDRDRLIKELIADSIGKDMAVDPETIQVVLEDIGDIDLWLYGI